MNHVLIRARLGWDSFERLRDGLAGDGDCVAVQHAVGEQNFHHLRDAAGGVQFGGDVFAGRFQIAKHWHALADGFEIVER